MPFYPAGHHFPFLASPRFSVTWPGLGRRVEPALAPEKGGDPRSGEDRRNPPSQSGRTSFMENLGFRVRENARFTHVIAFLRRDVCGKRFSTHGKTTERGNVAQKSLRFHARFYNSLKINLPENQA